MSQRINLQYSIDIDELEYETSRLISRAATKLTELQTQLSALNKGSDNSLTLSNFDEIVNVRKNLTSVDHQLSDIADIIKGYLSYRTTDPPAPDEQENLENAEDTPEEVYEDVKVVSDIQKRIQEFKENQLKHNQAQLLNEQNTTEKRTEPEQVS